MLASSCGLILWVWQNHRHVIILCVRHAYWHSITMRRRLKQAPPFNTTRTHAPLTRLACTRLSHDWWHAFLWKRSSRYHLSSTDTWSLLSSSCLVISTDTVTVTHHHCYHHLVLSTDTSSSYHHLVSSTDTVTDEHRHAIIILWVWHTHGHCYHPLVSSTDTSAWYHHLVSSSCISACYHNVTSTNARPPTKRLTRTLILTRLACTLL